METVHFLDDSNNLVDVSKATKVVIRETDSDGNLISETYGRVNNTRQVEKDNFQHKVSPDVQAFVSEFMQEHRESRKK